MDGVGSKTCLHARNGHMSTHRGAPVKQKQIPAAVSIQAALWNWLECVILWFWTDCCTPCARPCVPVTETSCGCCGYVGHCAPPATSSSLSDGQLTVTALLRSSCTDVSCSLKTVCMSVSINEISTLKKYEVSFLHVVLPPPPSDILVIGVAVATELVDVFLKLRNKKWLVLTCYS